MGGKGDDHISLHMCIKISSNIYKGNIKINLCKRVINGRKNGEAMWTWIYD